MGVRAWRRGLTVSLVGVGGLLLSGTVPAPALAATLPNVELAGSVVDDVGRLEVRASSDSPITEISARVLSPQTGETLVVVDDLRLSSGQPERGVWQTPDTLKLPALGDYPVEVEVADADGDRLPWPASGTLRYWVTPVFEPLTVTPTVVDLDHRTVTVAGRLVGRAPDTRALSPLGDAGITVGTSYEGYPARADADGRFSMELTIVAPTPVDVVYHPSAEHGTITTASSDRVEVTVDKAPTRIVADVAPATVHAGEEVVLSGRLEYENAGTWHPYGGVSVLAWQELTPIGGPAPEFLTTDADGRFRIATVPPRSGTWWVEYPAAGIDWFHGDSRTDLLPFRVTQSAAIADFAATRQGRQVTVGGRLVLSDPIVLPSADVDIEYSRYGRGGWTTVATLTAQGGDYTFAGQVPYRAGYWRAHFRGDGADHPAAVTGAVRVH